MPFGKRKKGSKFQVVNTETGDVKGTHDSEADADKQLAALHANDADKDKAHMDIRTKAVNATIEDTSASADEFPGTFLVELSNESLDRDGDTLKADEWETPLPEQITFVNDHTHKMASVVGSATPELVGGKILCKGEWAATANAQDTRKVIKHVPYVSVAFREKRDQKAGTVSRELVNGSFVVVPSNTKARVLASKSFDEMDDETKDFIKSIVLEAFHIKDTTSLLPEGFTAETLIREGEEPALQIKDASGTVLLSHKLLQVPVLDATKIKTGTFKLSQAPEAPSQEADQSADQAKDETAALAHAKAAAFQITSSANTFE